MVVSFNCTIDIAVGNHKSNFDRLYIPVETSDLHKNLVTLLPNENTIINTKTNLLILKCEEGGNLQIILYDEENNEFTLDDVSCFIINTTTIKKLKIINTSNGICNLSLNY